MFRKNARTLMLFILLILIAACSPVPEAPSATNTMAVAEVPSETPAVTEPPVEPSPTATQAPTDTTAPTPTGTPRTVIWEDDFSDVTSGWERYQALDGTLDYLEAEGIYQMLLTQEDSFFWVSLDENFSDLMIEIEASQMAGPEGSLFGVMCRYDPATLNGIVFLITSDGQAGVGTMENFDFNPLPGGELASFEAVLTGLEVVNTLEAACVGEQLAFSVNGERLFELPSPDVQGDDIGMVVDSRMGAGVDVFFDNLVIYQP